MTLQTGRGAPPFNLEFLYLRSADDLGSHLNLCMTFYDAILVHRKRNSVGSWNLWPIRRNGFSDVCLYNPSLCFAHRFSKSLRITLFCIALGCNASIKPYYLHQTTYRCCKFRPMWWSVMIWMILYLWGRFQNWPFMAYFIARSSCLASPEFCRNCVALSSINLSWPEHICCLVEL